MRTGYNIFNTGQYSMNYQSGSLINILSGNLLNIISLVSGNLNSNNYNTGTNLNNSINLCYSNVQNTGSDLLNKINSLSGDINSNQITGALLYDASELMQKQQYIIRSDLPPGLAAFLMIKSTGYFVYLGEAKNGFIPKYIAANVTTAGAGSQTGECGIFTTSDPPSKKNQQLTKVFSTNNLNSLTSLGTKRNTLEFISGINAGQHVWAGILTAMATTQPTVLGLGGDMSQGSILAGDFRGAGTTLSGFYNNSKITGYLITTNSSTASCPDLRIEII